MGEEIPTELAIVTVYQKITELWEKFPEGSTGRLTPYITDKNIYEATSTSLACRWLEKLHLFHWLQAISPASNQTCSTVHSGKSIVAKANHYTRLRKRLQHKGIRSATRRLKAISGRERRLKQDVNHVVSKRIVEQHPHSLIGLEDLTHIRERTKRRKGKQASKKQHRANDSPRDAQRESAPHRVGSWDEMS